MFFTAEQQQSLPPLYANEHHPDPTVVVRLIHPTIDWSWYVLEFDGEDLCFGWVAGDYKELGYFCLSELAANDVVVDTNFIPTPLSIVKLVVESNHGSY